MHTKDSAFKLARDILFGDPVTKQEERIEQAMLAVARCHGDIDQCKKMLFFHQEQLHKVDPHEDWWLFAHRRQKVHDYDAQLTALADNLQRLHARFDAIRSKA